MKAAFFYRRTVLAGGTSGIFLLFLAGMWLLTFERQSRAPVELAAKSARDSAELRLLLGAPLRISGLTKGNLTTYRGNGNADLTSRISGPYGSGTLYEWAQEGAGRWTICSLLFKADDGSARITIVDDSSTHCDSE